MSERKLLEIFVSYAAQDEQFFRVLERHLERLKKAGLVQVWSQKNIIAGMEWKGEIRKHLDGADIILLLVSPDFMTSEYILNEELGRAMVRAKLNEAFVIPILIRPTPWESSVFGKLQVLPRNQKPVTRWTNHEEAFDTIVEEIRKVVEHIQK